MNKGTIVVYCGLLFTLSASSVDILLPAFSAISQDLGAPYTHVQLTIPVFIFAIGIGQFFVGSLSDRFGRRPVIMAGLTVFIAGSILCALAPSIEILLVGRVLQGLGNSVGPVGRAIIRDLYEGDELARNIALATAVFAAGPIVAPLVGALFMLIAPWPVLFALMAVFGILLLLYCLFRLPETLEFRNPDATRPLVFATNIAALFRNPVSRFYLLLSGIIMSMMLVILAGSPRIFEVNFGVTGTLFAIFFATHGTGIIVGQIANRRMISAVGTRAAAVYGNCVLVLACVLMIGFTVTEIMNAYLLSGLFILFATSYLIVYANATALTLNEHGAIAGFASTFFGFFSQIVGSVISVLVIFLIEGDLLLFSTALFAISAFTLVSLIVHGAGTAPGRLVS